MKWLKKHQTTLKTIIEDIRLSPHRRLLGELLLLWLELETEEDKRFIFKVIENQYGSPQKTMWLEGDDPNISSKQSQVEIDATETLKKYFSGVKEEVPPEQLGLL